MRASLPTHCYVSLVLCYNGRHRKAASQPHYWLANATEPSYMPASGSWSWSTCKFRLLS